MLPNNKISIYDIDRIMKIKNTNKMENVSTNYAYGYFHHIKKYAGIPDDLFLNCVIVHGMGWNDYLDDREFSHNCSNILEESAFIIIFPLGASV